MDQERETFSMMPPPNTSSAAQKTTDCPGVIASWGCSKTTLTLPPSGMTRQRAEFQMTVAFHTGIRRPSALILKDELADYPLFHQTGKVKNPVGNPELIAHSLSVGDGFIRKPPGLIPRPVNTQQHCRPGNLITRLFEQQRRDGRIHPAAHGHQNFFLSQNALHASPSKSDFILSMIFRRFATFFHEGLFHSCNFKATLLFSSGKILTGCRDFLPDWHAAGRIVLRGKTGNTGAWNGDSLSSFYFAAGGDSHYQFRLRDLAGP